MRLLLIILLTLGVPLLFDPAYYWLIYLLGVLGLVWYVQHDSAKPRAARPRRHAFE